MQRLIRGGTLALIVWVLIMAAVCSGGCSVFSKEEAIFIAHNHSGDPVAVIVDGQERAQLAPNSTLNNEFIVLVPRPPVGSYGYGPSQVDRQVQVTAVFKNLRTGRLSRETYCTAGAKLKTLVVYEPQIGFDGYATCMTLY